MGKDYEPVPPINDARIKQISKSLEDCNSVLSPHFYEIFKAHLKKKVSPRIIEYKAVTKDHYQKLLNELENDYGQKIVFTKFPENDRNEELAAYFTIYLQLVVISSVPHIDAVLDFYRLKKRSMSSDPNYHYHANLLFSLRDRVLKVKNDALSNVKDRKELAELKNKKPTEKTPEKDYGAVPPESFFSEKDGEELERLLEKLVHTDCFLFGLDKIGVRYKKGSRGTNTEILRSSKKYYYALYTLFKTLNFTNADSAKHTQTCLQSIYNRIIKKYTVIHPENSLVYKASTILQNIKEDRDFNIDFKSAPIELLIPQI